MNIVVHYFTNILIHMIFMEVLETFLEILISMVLLQEEILLFQKQTEQNVPRSLHPSRIKSLDFWKTVVIPWRSNFKMFASDGHVEWSEKAKLSSQNKKHQSCERTDFVHATRPLILSFLITFLTLWSHTSVLVPILRKSSNFAAERWDFPDFFFWMMNRLASGLKSFGRPNRALYAKLSRS